jgi:hypothetical protein
MLGPAGAIGEGRGVMLLRPYSVIRAAPYLDSPCEPSLAMLRSSEGRHMLAAGIGGIGIVGVVIIVIIVVILFARR